MNPLRVMSLTHSLVFGIFEGSGRWIVRKLLTQPVGGRGCGDRGRNRLDPSEMVPFSGRQVAVLRGSELIQPNAVWNASRDPRQGGAHVGRCVGHPLSVSYDQCFRGNVPRTAVCQMSLRPSPLNERRFSWIHPLPNPGLAGCTRTFLRICKRRIQLRGGNGTPCCSGSPRWLESSLKSRRALRPRPRRPTTRDLREVRFSSCFRESRWSC